MLYSMTAVSAEKPMAFEVTFGDRLRRARLNLGMDQRDFAKGIDVHHATISRYEHDGGRDDASTRRLAHLVQGRYGIDAAWLLTGDVPGQRERGVPPDATRGYQRICSVIPLPRPRRRAGDLGALAPVIELRPARRAA